MPLENIYSCAQCGAEFFLGELDIVWVERNKAFIRCPNEDCLGTQFELWIREAQKKES